MALVYSRCAYDVRRPPPFRVADGRFRLVSRWPPWHVERRTWRAPNAESGEHPHYRTRRAPSTHRLSITSTFPYNHACVLACVQAVHRSGDARETWRMSFRTRQGTAAGRRSWQTAFTVRDVFDELPVSRDVDACKHETGYPSHILREIFVRYQLPHLRPRAPSGEWMWPSHPG